MQCNLFRKGRASYDAAHFLKIFSIRIVTDVSFG